MPWFRLLTAWPPTFKGDFPPDLKFKLLLQNTNNHQICFELIRNGPRVYIVYKVFYSCSLPFFCNINTFIWLIFYYLRICIVYSKTNFKESNSSFIIPSIDLKLILFIYYSIYMHWCIYEIFFENHVVNLHLSCLLNFYQTHVLQDGDIL